MKEIKNMSIESKLQFSEDSFIDPRYIKTRIKVMHSNKNPNGSHFSDENIERNKESLKNIFLLASVVELEDGLWDFGAHDFHVELNKMDINGDQPYKVVYDELAVGIIPETNNYEYIYDEELGKSFVWIDALIVRDYSNYAEDIVKRYIEEGKDIKISMEISVEDYEYVEKEKYYDIKDYTYTAITFLGMKYGTGMEGAKAIFNDDDLAFKFMEKVNELKSMFAIRTEERGVDEIKFDELKKKVEEFSLTMKQKWQKVSDSLENENYYDGEELIGAGYYWVRDFDEEFVYVEKYSWFMDGSDKEENLRVKYTFEDDECIINKESFEEIVYEPITLVEKKQLEKERSTVEMALDSEIAYRKETEDKIKDFDELTSKAEEFESTIQEKDAKIVELEEFKLEVETNIHKAEVEETLNSFKDVLDGNEEFDELREKAFEMEVDEVENACYQLIGKLNYIKNSKDKKTVPNKQFSFTSKTKVITEDEELKKYTKKYGVDMAKYFIKK